MDAWPPLQVWAIKAQPISGTRAPPHTLPSMAKSEKVPCFYAGQQDSYERPAKIVTRGEARLMKAAMKGKFENNGQIFRFSLAITERAKAFWDGPFGIGNLLPFSKQQNPLMAPEHLHYSIPACGAHGRHTSVRATNEARPLLSAALGILPAILLESAPC